MELEPQALGENRGRQHIERERPPLVNHKELIENYPFQTTIEHIVLKLCRRAEVYFRSNQPRKENAPWKLVVPVVLLSQQGRYILLYVNSFYHEH